MSSTNRGSDRKLLDQYHTPKWPLKRLLEVFQPADGPILDPCAGRGQFTEACVAAGVSSSRWYAQELDPSLKSFLEGQLDPNRVLIRDFLKEQPFPSSWPTRFGAVFTNPPYTHIQAFLTRGLQLSDQVIFLLSTGYLGTGGRAQSFREFPPDLYVLPERISFTGDGGSDSTNYAFYVWDKKNCGRRFGQYTMLGSTPKDERCLGRRPKKTPSVEVAPDQPPVGKRTKKKTSS